MTGCFLTIYTLKNIYVFCQPEHRQGLIYPRTPGDNYRQMISLFKAEGPTNLHRVTLSEAVAYIQRITIIFVVCSTT